MNSYHQWQFFISSVSHLRLCCLQGWDQVSVCVCVYIYSSNHYWKTARLFTHFSKTTHSVGQPHSILFISSCFQGQGSPPAWATARILEYLWASHLHTLPSHMLKTTDNTFIPRQAASMPQGHHKPSKKSKPYGEKVCSRGTARELEKCTHAPKM